MSSICVQPLALTDSAKAYGLMRVAKPSLTFSEWDEYVQERLTPCPIPRILAAVDGRGYLLGLVCFDIRHTLGHDRELVVEELVALGLFPAQIRSVTDGLLERCEAVADEHRCDGLRLEIARPVCGAWSDAVGWLMRGQSQGALVYGGVGHA